MLEEGRVAENIERLIHFGLTRQEARIYFLLLTEGELSGYEAAKRAGISRSNAYALWPDWWIKGRLMCWRSSRYVIRLCR